VTGREPGAAPAAPAEADARRVPGEPGLWILVLGDLVVFAVLFGAFLVDRAADPARFARAREELVLDAGVANTLILLTSSLLVARLVAAHRDGRPGAAGRCALGALACGATFVGVKAFEWTHLVLAGHGPETATFFTWFFVLTGLHLLHLLIGVAGLVVVHRVVRRGRRPDRDRALVEGVATYWHLVDLVWLVIFPLLYFSAT
jgi:nitric oxide reductase NorE protein